MFIYFLKTVQSFHMIFLQMLLILLGQSLIQKKLHSLKTSAESFWVILRLILVVFFYLLRAAKPFLIKVPKDAICISPTLTALKNFSQQVLLS